MVLVLVLTVEYLVMGGLWISVLLGNGRMGNQELNIRVSLWAAICDMEGCWIDPSAGEVFTHTRDFFQHLLDEHELVLARLAGWRRFCLRFESGTLSLFCSLVLVLVQFYSSCPRAARLYYYIRPAWQRYSLTPLFSKNAWQTAPQHHSRL